jgi:hypothetical protein
VLSILSKTITTYWLSRNTLLLQMGQYMLRNYMIYVHSYEIRKLYLLLLLYKLFSLLQGTEEEG